MKWTTLLFITFALSIGNSIAGEYANVNVEGWEIRQEKFHCVADHPSRGEFQLSIFVVPAGNWETHIVNLNGQPKKGNFQTTLVVGEKSFNESYIGSQDRYIGILPLNHRIGLANGRNVSFHIDGMKLDFSLKGSTAAMLKLEECWHQVTEYDPNISNKLGAYAFK